MIKQNCRVVATILSVLVVVPFAGGGLVVAFNRLVEFGSSFQIVSPIYAGDYGAQHSGLRPSAPLDPVKMFCENSIGEALVVYSRGRQTSEVESIFGKPAAIDGQIKLAGWPAACGAADQNWLYRAGVSTVVLSFHQGKCVGAFNIDSGSDFAWQHHKAQQLIRTIPGLTRQEVLKLLGGILETHPGSSDGYKPDFVNFSFDEADEITSFEIGYNTWLTVGWSQNKCLGGDEDVVVH